MKSLLPFCLFIVVVFVCVVLLVVASRAPHAVTVSIIGHTTNAAGVPEVIF
jgi:hypothetical protein